MVRQADDHAFPQRPDRRALDRLAALRVDDAEHLSSGCPTASFLRPAGQGLATGLRNVTRPSCPW